MAANMLVVKGYFDGYVKGDHITDPALVAKYLKSHRMHVVPINRPADPPPLVVHQVAETVTQMVEAVEH